jgi:hypothetical protein
MRLPEKARASAIAAIPDAGAVEESIAPTIVPPAIEETVAPSRAAVEITPGAQVVAPAPVEHTAPAPVVEHTAPVVRPRVAKPAPIVIEQKPAVVEPKPVVVEPKPVVVEPKSVVVEQNGPETKPQPSAELAAYRGAHELHFRGKDPMAALAAWDAYLAKYPNGSLALDARYDRALVLVKLSRWKEARAALAPFANAAAGSYRQREATEILAAIRDR